MIFHIERYNGDDCQETCCFIDAISGVTKDDIKNAFADLKAFECLEQDKQDSIRVTLELKFQEKFGNAPPPWSMTFSQSYPSANKILMVGKTHADFDMAKAAERAFLDERTAHNQKLYEYTKHRNEYISSALPSIATKKIEDFLPEGCKVIDLETIWID